MEDVFTSLLAGASTQDMIQEAHRAALAQFRGLYLMVGGILGLTVYNSWAVHKLTRQNRQEGA